MKRKREVQNLLNGAQWEENRKKTDEQKFVDV